MLVRRPDRDWERRPQIVPLHPSEFLYPSLHQPDEELGPNCLPRLELCAVNMLAGREARASSHPSSCGKEEEAWDILCAVFCLPGAGWNQAGLGSAT